jgi:tetratricopeptide (TPR) repeat protein
MPYHTLSNKIAIPVLFFLLLPVFINAQGKDETLAEKIKLEQKITESKTIAEKIQKTNSLALFHFAHNNNKAGDSLIDIIAILGTNSGKKEDVFASYRWSGNAYLSSNSPANREKGLAYLQQAVDYASKEKMVNEEIIALLNLGRQYTMPGADLAKAYEYFNRIDLNKEGVHDSSRFNYYYRKANLYFLQKKTFEGIKNLFSARKLAEKTKNSRNLAQVYQSLGDNYSQIKEYEKAIGYFQISKKYYGKLSDTAALLFADYAIGMAYKGQKNYPVAKEYFEKVIQNAEIARIARMKYSAVSGLWVMYYDQKEIKKGADIGRKYKLEDYYISTGDSALLYNTRAVYSEIDGKQDSADWYYRKTIDFTYKLPAKTWTPTYFYIYGDYLKRFKRYADALGPTKTALAKFDSLHYILNLPEVYLNLDSIYTALGDYKNAWEARGKYYLYRDSLNNQNKKEDILKEEIAAEEESMAKAQAEEIKATERKHDIQYRFIILGAILLLIGLLTIGFFHPPQWLVRGLAFVSFIFIFEFIILILDSKLHHWFHGAPLPILGVKVLIACLLVPLHHLVEKKVIHFLESKKLHRLKTVFKDEPVKYDSPSSQ